MLKSRSLVLLALCVCFLKLGIILAAPQESTASPMNAQNKIKIDEDINELRRIPYRYTPASAADVTNGRLAELLALHRASCQSGDPEKFYALFNRPTRYLYTKISQEYLMKNFSRACSDEFIGKYEKLFAKGELKIEFDGRTEQGIPMPSLYTTEQIANGIRRNGLEISVEGNKLKWGWH